ncbi:glutamate racemase [Desulfovibrio sp. OttesenSCG-928-F07]|nr:glutamate racemase [Desulfovibrio sp. OttesenSCG-928-F07]
MDSNLPIGVFDSGVGGLTVLRAMQKRLPHENMLYLGDTARLPYGTKSSQTVSRYSAQAAAKLVERKIKLLVVACNTATASALEYLQTLWPELPVIGVVAPGANAACAATKSGNIAVIGTESTIRNKAYHKAIAAIMPQAQVSAVPCSLFVSLAEEGWVDGPIVEAVARRYLAPLFSSTDSVPDCLVLGCTHFPALAGAIANTVGTGVHIVDSAATTAIAVEDALKATNGFNRQSGAGQTYFMTTDDTARFARTGGIFLGHEVLEKDIELVNL